jgi:hypothetical protein
LIRRSTKNGRKARATREPAAFGRPAERMLTQHAYGFLSGNPLLRNPAAAPVSTCASFLRRILGDP